jgi:hypothetical protein
MILKNSPWSLRMLENWDGLYNRYKNVANHDQIAFQNMFKHTPKEMKILPPKDFMTYDTHNCVKPDFGIHFPAGNKYKRIKHSGVSLSRDLSVNISGKVINYQPPGRNRDPLFFVHSTVCLCDFSFCNLVFSSNLQ